jgi:hypothetical protein
VDLIHLISRLRTPTTGNYYGEIQRWRFDTARRLMYNCPDGFDDGLPVDFKIVGFDIGDAIKTIKADSNKVDICLVDGWHTYDCTIRDLTLAYDLLALLHCERGLWVRHYCRTGPGSSWRVVLVKNVMSFYIARSIAGLSTTQSNQTSTD